MPSLLSKIIILCAIGLSLTAQTTFAQNVVYAVNCPNGPVENPTAFEFDAFNALVGVNFADLPTAQAFDGLVARWAPFSPMRAKKVFDRGLKLLTTVRWIWNFPPPAQTQPEGTPVNCFAVTAAKLDDDGRMIAAKRVWATLSSLHRAIYVMQLAMSQEAQPADEKSFNFLRDFVVQIAQGTELTEKMVTTYGLLISKNFYREVFFENGDYALEPPVYNNTYEARNGRAYCGYGLKGQTPVNECGGDNNRYRVFGLDPSKILRITREDLRKPVYLYPPVALGLPADVSDYVFAPFFSSIERDEVNVALTFSEEKSFRNADLKVRCAKDSPVAFTMKKAALDARDFGDLRFQGCQAVGESELFINSEFVRLPLKFNNGFYHKAHIINEIELAPAPPKAISFGKIQINLGSGDTLERQADALKITFKANSKKALETGIPDCKTTVVSATESAAGRRVAVSAKKTCAVATAKNRLNVKGEIELNADSGGLSTAKEGSVRVGKQDVGAANLRFRPDGELWSFEPANESEGFKYFDTYLNQWMRKEAYFPSVSRICFNGELRRFEDGRTSNPACPPIIPQED